MNIADIFLSKILFILSIINIEAILFIEKTKIFPAFLRMQITACGLMRKRIWITLNDAEKKKGKKRRRNKYL